MLTKARLKRIIAAGNAAAMGIGLWTIFFASVFYVAALVLSALLPLFAIALDVSAKGALSFEARRGRKYPFSIATVLIMPALVLYIRAILDLNFIDQRFLIAEALIAALAIIGLFWRFDEPIRKDRNQLATIAVFAIAYAYGALAFADTALDPSGGRDVAAVMRDKRVHVSGGVKGSSIWREVAVDPEAVPTSEHWIHVRPDRYAGMARGDAVCVHTGAGLLAARWYDVRVCRPSF